jgi:UDP-glucuronate decarboxylase
LIENDIRSIIRNLNNITFEDKNILITGGAGFIGSWLCQVLVEQNANIICVDNLSSGLESNIKELIGKENFTFINHDITNCLDINKKIDIVMHLASRASPLEFDKFPIQILEANTIGLCNTLKIAKKNNARFLFTSTSEVYGDSEVIPTSEMYNGNVNTLGIRGCYDEAKRCGEAFCMAYKRQYNLDVRIARIFNTYGPRIRADGYYGRAIPRFIDQALNNRDITIFGDGSQTRSFTYITDQIEGLLKLLAIDNINYNVINIGNDNEISILELANIIINITKSGSDIVYSSLPENDPTRRCPDIILAKRLLNWNPRTDLSMGLEKTIEWFRKIYIE